MTTASQHPVRPGATATVEVHGWAHGGDGVGRLPDGRACFVRGALPGEVVRVVVRQVRKRHATADLLEVLDPSPHRVVPPCPYAGRCGGCQLQHADPPHQLELKTRVVAEQLQRIGRVPDPPVRPATAPDGGWPGGYRAWARMGVAPDGRLGYRRARSHEIEPIDRCLLLTPAAQALREAAGDAWQGAEEVVLTAGDEGRVVLARAAGAGRPEVPDGTFGAVLDGPGGGEVLRDPTTVTFDVAGMRLRASAGAFFQAGPAAAAALVGAVLAAAGDVAGTRALDLYSGVGLFSTALALRGASVVAVESDETACADAVHNAAVHGVADRVAVQVDDVTRALAELGRPPVRGAIDLVVLDPPRAGAGEVVSRQVAGLGARTVVYVACDPAALARDVAVLRDAGLALHDVAVLDLFGHTAHVEAVALLGPA